MNYFIIISSFVQQKNLHVEERGSLYRGSLSVSCSSIASFCSFTSSCSNVASCRINPIFILMFVSRRIWGGGKRTMIRKYLRSLLAHTDKGFIQRNLFFLHQISYDYRGTP